MLPVTGIIPELKESLKQNRITVLSSPPGSGKTTMIPPALLEEPWLENKKILMLEPRRLATRAAANRISQLSHTQPGKLCGYRIRNESRTSPATKIEVLTEAILCKMLIDDPEISSTGLIIFDEFHERNLYTDLSLAMSLDCRKLFREDLRILIMSATLDLIQLKEKLPDASFIQSEGKIFPVKKIHLPPTGSRLEQNIHEALEMAIPLSCKGILVFLPGKREIRNCETHVQALCRKENLIVQTLHGQDSMEDQNRVLYPEGNHSRRVILTTNVAESSVTFNDIDTVIDSGLERNPVYSGKLGSNRLETGRISLDSADQRSGRAGRTGPGHAIRLWSIQEEAKMRKSRIPAILNQDLTDFTLFIASWGTETEDLFFLDRPKKHALEDAHLLLRNLGAIDQSQKITASGSRMISLPFPPRLAAMILEAKTENEKFSALVLATLLTDGTSELSKLTGSIRIPELLEKFYRLCKSDGKPGERNTLDLSRFAKIIKKGNHLPDSFNPPDDYRCAELLAVAYPEQLAIKKSGKQDEYISSEGELYKIDSQYAGYDSKFMAMGFSIKEKNTNRVLLAAPIQEESIRSKYGRLIQTEERIEQDRNGVLISETIETIGKIVLSKKRNQIESGMDREDAIRHFIKATPIEEIFSPDTIQVFLIQYGIYKSFINHSTRTLDLTILNNERVEWMEPWISGMQKPSDLSSLQIEQLIGHYLGDPTVSQFPVLFPGSIQLSNGKKLKLTYTENTVIGSIRIQELFGIKSSPRLPGLDIPIVIELLSPAHRPVQKTSDLGGFWTNTYHDVKKELKGRYPRHSWPDDPANASPPIRGKKN